MAGLGRRACRIAIIALSFHMLTYAQEGGNQQNPPNVSASDSMPINGSSATPAPKSNIANVMKTVAKLDCEAKLADIQSRAADLEDQIQIKRELIENATVDQAKAQELFDASMAKGMKAQALNFGAEYKAVMARMRQLQVRDRDDRQHKKDYMKMNKELPTATKIFQIALDDVKKLKAGVANMKKEVLSSQEATEASLAQNKLLKKQFPLNKEIISQRFAPSIIKAMQKLGGTQRIFKQESAKDNEIARQLKPLEDVVKAEDAKLKAEKASLEQSKQDYKNTNIKIVQTTKAMNANVQEMKGSINLKQDAQNKARANEMKNKRDALEEDEESASVKEQQAAKTKVKEEAKDEKEIEQEEAESEAAEEPQIQEQKREQAELEQEQQRVEAAANKRLSKAEVAAAKQVDVVKELWANKLQTEKDKAAGKTLPNPVENKLEDERASVDKLAEELRSDVNQPITTS